MKRLLPVDCLVAEQRNGPLAQRADLRDRDLVSLSSILDLPADELERYIDRELARFVANTTTVATSTAVVASTGQRYVRRLIFVIALMVVAAGVAVVATMAARSESAPAAPAASVSPGNGASRT
jgi:hypothetical protein